MKPQIFTTIFTALLLSVSAIHAQPPEEQEQKTPASHPVKDVTVRGTIIAIPNVAATQFSAKQDLNGKPAEALRSLEKMVANRMAVPVAHLAATMQFGQSAESKSGKYSLEFDAFLAPDEKTATVRLMMTDCGHMVKTFLHVAPGTTKFLGCVQDHEDESMTDYIFVRVSY